jgi:23S rRNA G2445 N2-methylase RlmL
VVANCEALMHRWDGHAPRAQLHFMVRTLRGLETIARDEVCALLDGRDVRVEHRAVRFSLPCMDPRVLALGTVDDAFLVVAEAEGIGRQRLALGALAALTRSVDVAAALVAVGRPQPRTFDVTASFIGRRNYSRFEIEEHVASAVAAVTGWSHRPREGALSLRVHVLHERATLAVRLASVPLHRRAYRVASRPGALHPPLARALAVVAAPAAGDVVVDPTCGVGTIPIEAALLEPRVVAVGSDLDRGAVAAARANARRAGVDLRLHIADAAALPLGPGAAHRVVVNPPWGRAVAGRGALRRASLWAELHRVLAPGGRLVALVPADRSEEQAMRRAGLDAEVVTQVRVSGAEAVILGATPSAGRRGDAGASSAAAARRALRAGR